MVPDKKFNLIEKEIRDKCGCNGEHCSTCSNTIARLKSYANAGIPMGYWMLAFKDFKGDPNFKNAMKEKIIGVENLYKEGQSLAFVGNLGTGKTYAACCILKKAIMSGYSSKYINMSDIVRQLTANYDYSLYDELVSVDFLCIDEFDSRWVFPSEKSEQLFGQTLEMILRTRFQNKLPVILCSNTPDLDDVLAGDFARSISSLFHKFVQVYYVVGKDFRKQG